MVYVPFDWSFVRSLCGAAMYSTRRVLSVDVHMWCSEKRERESESERSKNSGAVERKYVSPYPYRGPELE